jgi:cell filamentation protein
VTFDPFGDFATQGYLRNVEKEANLDIVKRLEHVSFTTGLGEAFTELKKPDTLSYSNILQTHEILFDAVYPWAGQDRSVVAPRVSVRKGRVIFANPSEIRPAAEFALRKGQEEDYLRTHPGEIMGYLAFSHPFLDGNGRTILTVFSELARRAGFSVEWSATDKNEYLDALTREIDTPSKGHLDRYLQKFMRDPIAFEKLATQLVNAPGLDGRAPVQDENEVVGNIDAPEVKAQYRAMVLRREKGE